MVRKVQAEDEEVVSVKASCGAEPPESVRRWEGVVVPRPTNCVVARKMEEVARRVETPL